MTSTPCWTRKHITPMNLAFTDIVLATLTPMAMLLTWRLHSIPTKWLWSVVGRIRWKFLLACLGASVVTLVAAVVVQNLVHADTGDPSSPVIPWSSTLAGFFLVIAFLTPLQATGEEFMFRGYLLQALGSLSRRVWVPVVLSGLVFGIFHGLGQSPPVFLDRFAFGLIAGYLAVRTGGLEAGIAMHLLNNWLSLSVAAATGQLDDALHPTAGSWWTLPVHAHPVPSSTSAWCCSSRAGWTYPCAPRGAFWRRNAAACNLSRRSARCARITLFRGSGGGANAGQPLGYGVIGSTTGSGPVSLGSSPSTPARVPARPVLETRGRPDLWDCVLLRRFDRVSPRVFTRSPPLCSGLARRPLKAVAPVRIRSGVPPTKGALTSQNAGSGPFLLVRLMAVICGLLRVAVPNTCRSFELGPWASCGLACRIA